MARLKNPVKVIESGKGSRILIANQCSKTFETTVNVIGINWSIIDERLAVLRKRNVEGRRNRHMIHYHRKGGHDTILDEINSLETTQQEEPYIPEENPDE